ncbi:MAG TPA: flippase-like domain-containing protein [Conexibacter sp.]|jgi:phosphatidylinositol alpha-mannosyltransferase|nr:flippase-like domain-containing protein [Conexibacter sp.]
MRVALVSPYSWTYPGGVTRHIEALAEGFLAEGHDVRVLAPYDPDDRVSAVLHRGTAPQRRALPDYLIPLGRSMGFKANGAVSNLCARTAGLSEMRRELRAGNFDVVHLHEPVVPMLCWDACTSTRVPLVGTFHCYSTSRLTNNLANALGARRQFNHLHVRIAVSEAAAWTAQRFFGGRYRIIPNGVAVPDERMPREPSDRLRLAFVGQAVERKGLPVLLRAFEALREHIPVELTVVGANRDEVQPLLLDDRGVTVLGRVDDAQKQRVLESADLLCAPSLGGESFGMVLTEGFATGTPVVASDIAGYRDVVRDGVDGQLVPRGDASALAETLRDLWLAPERRVSMGQAAAQRAERFAWPHVAREVLDAYGDAIATPAPQGAVQRAAVRIGVRPADLQPHVRPQRLPSIEPPPPAGSRRPAVVVARRVAMLAFALLALVGTVLAFRRIGVHEIVLTLLGSSPAWVLVGLGLMCAAMAVRAVSWYAILKAAIPRGRVRLRDAMQGTFIGVLMSATLPARLGEPSRALVVARRTGRPREHLPIVLGTIVSQALLNIFALLLLGIVTFSTVSLFSNHHNALIVVAIMPLLLLAMVLLAPPLLSAGRHSRFAKLRELTGQTRDALARVRNGLAVFREPRLGSTAIAAQLTAWALQWLSCYVLLVALGLDHRAGAGAAAAVLFAVNVTAVLPATPSNLGIFQAACVVVLSGGYGVSQADALGYGIILQAVEIATAVIMGMPALVKEGLSWRDVRLRALQTAPVELRANPREAAASRPAASEA